jgi:hypothetical protein
MRGYCPNTDCSEDRHQFSLLTGQWNFPALLQRIARGLDRHVRFGSDSEVLMLNRKVRFALKNGPRQPHLLGPKSVKKRLALAVFPLRTAAYQNCALRLTLAHDDCIADFERHQVLTNLQRAIIGFARSRHDIINGCPRNLVA